MDFDHRALFKHKNTSENALVSDLSVSENFFGQKEKVRIILAKKNQLVCYDNQNQGLGVIFGP